MILAILSIIIPEAQRLVTCARRAREGTYVLVQVKLVKDHEKRAAQAFIDMMTSRVARQQVYTLLAGYNQWSYQSQVKSLSL